ncbi:MAG: DUF2188 domain-containing protein [Gammaproteobacteria bacterium]|nr:DUF2188 domain-containing protein [Gammaproteobacteria bacterium]
MSKKNQHVVPHQGGWAVKSEGASKASSIHQKQSDAISQARNTAIKNKTEMLIHGKNGQIRERNTYGKDPFPPKG